MKKTEEIKLMIIENFIDYFTSSEEERKSIKESAGIYVDEDHVDEIAQAFPEIKEKETKIFQLLEDDGEPFMLVKTDMDSEVLDEKFRESDFDYPDEFIKKLTDEGFSIERVFVEEINS